MRGSGDSEKRARHVPGPAADSFGSWRGPRELRGRNRPRAEAEMEARGTGRARGCRGTAAAAAAALLLQAQLRGDRDPRWVCAAWARAHGSPGPLARGIVHREWGCAGHFVLHCSHRESRVRGALLSARDSRIRGALVSGRECRILFEVRDGLKLYFLVLSHLCPELCCGCSDLVCYFASPALIWCKASGRALGARWRPWMGCDTPSAAPHGNVPCMWPSCGGRF